MLSGVFCTNNAQAPSLFSNITLTSRRTKLIVCWNSFEQQCPSSVKWYNSRHVYQPPVGPQNPTLAYVAPNNGDDAWLWKRTCLRPAGSDPEVVCQKDSFLKGSVSLGGFGPSVAHGKHSVRRRCVQATKKQGRKLLSPWRHWVPFVRPLKGGYKNRCLGKSRGVRFDSRNGCSVFLLALLNVSWNTHAVSLLHAL